YRRFRPSDASVAESWAADGVPSRLDAARLRLIETDSWHAYRVFRSAQAALTGARRVARRSLGVVRRLAGRVRHIIGLAYYHLQLTLPVDERLAVYTAYWDRGYGCNPAAIYYLARTMTPEIQVVCIVHGRAEGQLPPGVPYVIR